MKTRAEENLDKITCVPATMLSGGAVIQKIMEDAELRKSLANSQKVLSDTYMRQMKLLNNEYIYWYYRELTNS